MSLTVKAYLDRGVDTPEIRRFAVDQSVSASLTYMTSKIGSVFPDLSSKPYDLYWQGEWCLAMLLLMFKKKKIIDIDIK